jgi:hypothetical protein
MKETRIINNFPEEIMSGRPAINRRAKRCAIQTLLTTVALLALFLGSRTVNAQVLYGSITGTVSDKTGAVVPNVTVTITDQGTGAVRTAVSDGRGDYALLNMLPGTFTVSVAKSGAFAGYQVKDIVVEVNRQVRVDIALVLASVTAEVTITSAPPELQTETAVVNHEISEAQLDSLPITSGQGRNFQAVYSIIPGAAAVTEQNSTASNPSRAMSMNVNGLEHMGVSMRIDGAMNTYGWLPYIVAYLPPTDAVENVNIATNSFNAEQGMAGGAAVNVTVKTGTKNFHGGAWEYYQDAFFNARGYTATKASLTNATNPTGSVPKNVFDQFGFNIGGPVYIPKILTGKKKLFFFQNFERTTRRSLATGQVSVPDVAMLGGSFDELASAPGVFSTTLYDPQPITPDPNPAHYAHGYLLPQYRTTTFFSEYGCNCIPAGRQSTPAQKMLALLKPIATAVGTPTTAILNSGMANDYNGTGTTAYNRNTSDSKVTYIPTENTQVFGRYSIEPFTVNDPQQLGQAGGGTFDGGQPGAAAGRIQNSGLGFSHVFTPNLVMDADFGYTRQVTGAQSTLDIADGDFGTDVLGIPGTNGVGKNYVGQPIFAFTTGATGATYLNTLGNANGANPFLFRDNQFTGDVNVSWTKGKHATKYGYTWYHFDLNHFQPTSGSGINNPRGGFLFQGGMTICGSSTCGVSNYNALADFLLGLPNNNTATAVTKATQLTNPNSLRWSTDALYAQDQWIMTSKLTLNYGVRYEFYPAPYRDHTGVYTVNPTLPQSGNVEIGGVGGNPENAGVDMVMPFKGFTPRLGVAYRLNEKTVIRSGGGLATDPDSLRFLRDSFPEDLAPSYSGTATGTISFDPVSGNALTLTNGIPAAVIPNLSSGFVSLPISGATTTAPMKYRRGYIESWNLFIQRDLGHDFVANVGYVGMHQVRQLAGVSYLNSAPLPSGATPCMANGQLNPSTGLSGPCGAHGGFAANETINEAFCSGSTGSLACYNTGGINVSGPIFSSNYNGLQTQLTRNAGKNSSFGVVYTRSHAIDFEDNGAGSGGAGTTFNYPAMYKFNRATAGYDRKNNFQFWGIYSLPFGPGQKFADHGVAGAIVGGFRLNGQLSHISGAPFSVNANSNNINTPGAGALYADLVAKYQQIGGRERQVGKTGISGGKPWFNPASFNNPVEPTYTGTETPAQIIPPHFGSSGRNQFRGPGQTLINASIFRAFPVYRENKFEIRFEAFNVLNHALLSNPNTTVPKPSALTSTPPNYGNFGMITANYGNARTVQFGGRYTF